MFLICFVSQVVCKIPLLARRTRPKGQARRATIGILYTISQGVEHDAKNRIKKYYFQWKL